MTQSRPSRPHDHGKPYAEQDLGEVDPAPFTQRLAPDGVGAVVSGTCPRCHGRTETVFPWATPGTGVKGPLSRLLGGARSAPGAGSGPGPLTSEVHFCECGHAHPQSPPDTSYRGCGASWRIRR
ncbi:hypothetical protein OG285_15395 [Streptomyces sp. NBC_01471]|uniref:hypothetical protein n=1 Tax=Streptomyces sp. NBC_01471 TaxID=2903879 RepID=UPI003245DF67